MPFQRANPVASAVSLSGPVVVGGLVPGNSGVLTVDTTTDSITPAAGTAVMYVQNIGAETIWYSHNSGLTADDNATTGGLPIPAGANWAIPSASQAYFRTASGTAKLAYIQYKTS